MIEEEEQAISRTLSMVQHGKVESVTGSGLRYGRRPFACTAMARMRWPSLVVCATLLPRSIFWSAATADSLPAVPGISSGENMQPLVNLWPLLGIAAIVVGFYCDSTRCWW